MVWIALKLINSTMRLNISFFISSKYAALKNDGSAKYGDTSWIRDCVLYASIENFQSVLL